MSGSVAILEGAVTAPRCKAIIMYLLVHTEDGSLLTARQIAIGLDISHVQVCKNLAYMAKAGLVYRVKQQNPGRGSVWVYRAWASPNEQFGTLLALDRVADTDEDAAGDL